MYVLWVVYKGYFYEDYVIVEPWSRVEPWGAKEPGTMLWHVVPDGWSEGRFLSLPYEMR